MALSIPFSASFVNLIYRYIQCFGKLLACLDLYVHGLTGEIVAERVCVHLGFVTQVELTPALLMHKWLYSSPSSAPSRRGIPQLDTRPP